MKWFILCCLGLLALVRGSVGSLADEMAETTQLCCNQGTAYARNHTSDDCSMSIPPDVPSALGSLCIFAMDQCCKEYFQKKRDCEAGIEIAKTANTCGTASSESKKCCNQCTRGAAVGSSQGANACSITSHGTGAELLAGEAYMDCCKKAAKDAEIKKEEELQPATPEIKNPGETTAYSLCEDFAPNELCAHHCIPVPGSYRCECNPGFRLMADGRNCMEITKNRCKPHNPCHHKCNDNGVEVKCSCRRGYQLMSDGKSCEDIDECVTGPPPCLPNTECHNVQGSYKCIPVKHPKIESEKGQCPPGFTRNLKNNACDDINECKLPKPPCPFYLCENTIGGYKCGGVSGDPTNLVNQPRQPVEDRCPPGFKSSVGDECEDVDECAINKDDCNKLSQFCINTRGSFYCQEKVSKHCPPGFKANPVSNKCEDIDECEDAEDRCKPDQICVNVPGEYDCRPKGSRISKNAHCPDGFRTDPSSGICEDINECVEGTHLCDQYQSCLNTNGSHECRCKIGFELDPTTGACADINECATDQNNCIPESQRCDNTVGSFLCIRFISCGTGYILHHSSSTCEDVDECALGTHNCARAGPEYQCVNIPGSFRCQRKPTPAPPSSSPLPEYEYEYYDSEEEIEDSKNTSQATTKTEAVTTTTPKPEITTEVTRPPPPSAKPTKPIQNQPDIEPVEETHSNIPEDIDNNIIEPYNKPEPAFPITPEVPQYTTPRPTPTHPKPTEPIRYPQESYPRATETTYRPITEENIVPTSPKLVSINVGEETATVQGEKGTDGSVVVNVVDIPKNEWTKINQRPDCGRGFEPGSFGECVEIQFLTDFKKEEIDRDGKAWTMVDHAAPMCINNFTVTDIDECATNRHVCSGLTEVCRNTMGGYLCDCVAGFRRDLATGVCAFITKPAVSSSTSTTTSTSAPPPPIYLPSPSSTPFPTLSPATPPPTDRPTTPPPTDAPTTSPPTTPTTPPTTPPSTTPPPTSTSSTTKNAFWNNYPSYRVPNRTFRPRNSCDVGYHLNINTGQCEDVNECVNGQANCASVEICVNTEGGYRCDCPPNWRLDRTRHRCVPFRKDGEFPTGYGNEPSYPPVYPNEIYGHGTKGHKFVSPDITAYDSRKVVKCPHGYRLGDENTCEDINECSTGEAKCGVIQICTNLPGGYSCSCPAGHRLVGDHECEDVDECALAGGMPVCSKNADCVNTIGSYQCRCHEGFRPAPVNDKVCIDLDECTESRPGALCQQRCNNVWGGYRCSCHRGYRLNPDNSTCSDVDECTEYKSKYLCRGRCVNEPGSYRCTCPAGYRLSLDQKSCIDIDECETGEATCAKGGQYGDSSDVCLNTRGGHRCQRISCPAGYRLESKHRCTKIETVCAPNDWNCAHQPTTISYNFITFVSNLAIPQPDNAVNLFTMLGPTWPNANIRFMLRLVNVDAPPNVKKADFTAFSLKQNHNQGVTSLVKSLEGPQSIELEMSMELYNRDMFGGIAVARIYIYVSEYEF